MNRGAATKPKRIKRPSNTARPRGKMGSPKSSESRRTAAQPATAKHRAIPPATRPGFRVPSLTKKSVTFVLDAPSGRDVAIAGSFSDWEPRLMTKGQDGLWRTTLQLAHGTYQYRFLVDSQWQEDHSNPRKRRDELGAFNSVCDVL